MYYDGSGLFDYSTGLWLSPWGWWRIEQVFLLQRKNLIVQVKDLFVFISIWIDFLHQPTDCNCTDRVGRQHTELPFFSFMAGWEKEGGQWFLRALVGSQLYSFHCTSMLPFHIPDVDKYFWIRSSNHFTFLLFSSGQNSRIVHRGRRQLHGVQEDRGQQQMWRFELKMICSVNLYFHFGDLAQ